MQIVINIPNSDIPLKQDVITLDLHFIDGRICECTYPFKELPKGHGDIKDENEIIKRLEEKEKEPLYQHYADDWWVGIIDAETVVNNSPTILDADV